jgi:uncharacterized integral membrane protein
MLRFILGIVIGIVVIIFFIQNLEIVRITFLTWTIEMSRAVMALVFFFFGIVVGWIISGLGRFRRRRKT